MNNMEKKSADDIVHGLSLEYRLGVNIPCYNDKVKRMKEYLAPYEAEIENLRLNLKAAYQRIEDLEKATPKDPCVHRYANVCLRRCKECTVPLCKKGKDDNEFISDTLKSILEYLGREEEQI